MASIVQYTKIMRDAQWSIARKLGADPSTSDKQTRVMMISALVVLATLIKLLVDTGKLTDAQLLAAINQVRSDAYQPPEEPSDPSPWDTTPVTGI